MTAVRADVCITGGGTVILFLLETPEARQWVDEHVSRDRQMFGHGLTVEHRHAAALVEGMRDGGLVIDGTEVQR